MRSLENMSVLITGGGSGIGAGTAAYFAERGARVTICGRRKEKIAAVAEKIGERCLAITADITSAHDRERLIKNTLAHGEGLDVLINNAGNMLRGPITELDENELVELFHTNVIAAMMMAGLAVPHLEKKKGAIIFIGSVHTRRAFPDASPYAASKSAVETASKVLAAELGSKNIRVNCVIPGAVFTEINQRAGLLDDKEARERLEGMVPMHPLGRIGTAEEIAEGIAYLVSADWTTGAVLDIDGGLGLGLANA